MTFPIKTILPTVVTNIEGISGLMFRKRRVNPIQTEGNFSQYELPNGLYEICQDDQYLYLFVEEGKGKYVTITGALERAELLDLIDKS